MVTNSNGGIPHNIKGEELRSYQKAFIGAAGGFSLVLLKLIEEKFFIGAAETKIIVGYLTYGSYIILGMIVATFLTDHDLTKEKGKRQALIMGLLAPSILIAIMTNSNTGNNFENKPSNINKVKGLGFNISLISSAYAEEPDNLITIPSRAGIKIIKKSDVEPSVKDAFLEVIGRKSEKVVAAFVVGSSNNAGRAMEVAWQLNTALDCSDNSNGCAEVITPEGGGLIYVTVGGLQEIEWAIKAQSFALQRIITSIESSPEQYKGKLVSLISQGQLVEGREFFEK